MTKSELFAYLEGQSGVMAAINDQIWSFAELGMEEVQSSAALADYLQKEGFTVTFGVGRLPTAFHAVFGAGHPRIALLGEYDALPGMSQVAGVSHPAPETGKTHGHGCGHHLLGAAAAAAAVAVSRWLAATQSSGTVEFFGCPAEENLSGKAIMAKSGAFSGLDAALTWHPTCYNAVQGVSTLANYKVGFSFSGVSAHAAIAPHLGRSALDSVELMNVGANYLREHVPSQARIHYAITDAGGDSANIVQAHARVEYIIRAPQLDQVGDIYLRLRDIAEGAALMSGTRVEIELIKTCANIINNKPLERVLQKNISPDMLPAWSQKDKACADAMIPTIPDNSLEMLSALAGPQAVAELKRQSLHEGVLPYISAKVSLPASSDVGDVSWNVPTAQFTAACFAMGTTEHTWQLVAQGKSPVAHKGMVLAAKVLAGSALDLFCEPETLEQAGQELNAALAGRQYKEIFLNNDDTRGISQ